MKNKYYRGNGDVDIMDSNPIPFSTLLYQEFETVKRVSSKDDGFSNDGILFINDDDTYLLTHNQDCSEGVEIEDIVGDLSDLENSKILFTSENKSANKPEYSKKEEDTSNTWCFYNISTIKGTVTIRFYGGSNGYYSEDANLYLIEECKYNKKSL